MLNNASGVPSENSPAKKSDSNSVGYSSVLSIGSIIAALILFAALFASDIPAWRYLFHSWTTSPDNSHGLLVPIFAAWLLWHRRFQLPARLPTVSWVEIALGLSILFAGILIRWAGIYMHMITVEGFSILPCLLGIVLCCGGWISLRWAWLPILFLVFMIPIPEAFGGMLSSNLQTIATISSTYFLQIIGIPAVSEGNIIWLTNKSLGVAEACSGIRMLTTFFALGTAVAAAIERPVWEKLLIIITAPAVAILANVLRISVTALAYEYGNDKLAELIFHDLAGWLMMPAGLLMLWAELFIFSKLFQNGDQQRFELVMTER